MPLAELLRFSSWVVLLDLIGALVIVGYSLAALSALVRGCGVVQARLLVADGAVLGLSFKVAGTLLRTLDLHTWEQIALFAAVLTLRTILKWLFAWERRQLGRVQE